MIVFTAFTPHSPLLLPALRKEEQEKKLAKTIQSFKFLAEELYAKKPDTLILISEHSASAKDVFVINMHDQFSIYLSEFGDHTKYRKFKPDFLAIDRIQRHGRIAEQPITLETTDSLDYGCAVPLILLAEQLKNVKIIPISPSTLTPKDHFKFGKEVGKIIKELDQRIAIIASGDLSHCLTSDAPGGFSEEGQVFDNTIQELVSQSNTAGLLKMDEKIVKASKECGYLSLLVMLGMIDKVQHEPNILSYESPFGVGHLTINFQLK